MRFLIHCLLSVGKKNTMALARILSDILLYFNKSIALICDRFVKSGEPAVVIVFPIKIKVVEEIRPEFAAAGSLHCWRGKAVGIMADDYMVARLLGSFLIVNCQLEFLEVRSFVISHWSLVKEVRIKMTKDKGEIAHLSLRSTLGPRP